MQNSDSSSMPSGLFTSCPCCLKQFRIHASQLSTAAGQVECGVCGHQFSALSRLSDFPLPIDQINYEYDYESVQKPEPEPEPEPEPGPESWPEPWPEPWPEQGQDPVFDIPDLRNEKEADSKEVRREEVLLGELPDELCEELPAKRSLFATIGWGLGTVLFLIIIIAQLFWFNRDELLLRFPQLEPVAREVCERLQCEILRYKDISLIKLINRDVRNHPLYEGSLLVNATMANKSETIQPFPLIQLALFNTGGEVIGYREFKPEEYLDDSISIRAGMLPESPIHFVLEVSGPTKDAVSFEFHFL